MSKSCTPQSRNMPPEAAMYACGGGAGSSVVDRTVCSHPSSPLRTAACTAAIAASNRRWKPIWTGTSESCRCRSTAAPSAPLRATGFSQNTGTPASTAATMSCGWASVDPAMTTPSTPAASSASGESAGSAPNRSATCFVAVGAMSVTTRESTAGRLVNVPAWKPPILPSPMSPRRMMSDLSWLGGCQDPVRIRHRRGPASGEHVDDPAGGVGERGGRRSQAQPHHMRGEHHVGAVEQRMVLWWFGVEDVESDAGELPGLQRGQGGVQVEQPPTATVDQNRSGSGASQELVVDKVTGFLRQRRMQRQHVAAGGELVEVRARDVGGWRTERVVREYVHPDCRRELAHPLTDAAITDDADRRAVQVAGDHPVPLPPAALPDEIRQRPQPLDEVQCHRQDALRDGPGAAAGRDHDRDPPGAGRGQVDQVDADAGASQHTQRWGAIEEVGIHHRVGARDGAHGDGEVGLDRLGDVVRIVDGGVAALAAGDRDEELLRLDDLEVVVPHAVTGAGLEMRVVAQVSIAQHRGVAVVRTTATDADP